MKIAIVNLLTAYLLCCAAGVYAQESNTEEPQQKWYQIEVLIFSHTLAANGEQETWPKELGLKYPQRIVELKQTAQTEILLNDWQQNADTESSPATDSELESEGASNNNLIEDVDTSTEANNFEQFPSTEITGSDTEVAVAPLLVTLQEQPFTLLDSDQLGFNEIKQQLLKQRGFRQLFHGAWRQPIGARNDSESILIRGGDQFDNHYELEGSISLGLERYLHISTDLWLSTFVSNVGREDHLWPILPKVPITSSAAQTSEHSANSNTRESFDDLFTNNDIWLNSSLSFENPFLDLDGNDYSIDQTIALRQSRRMRSNELHYIDHPLMGLLVKITAYEFPEAEQELLPEQESEQESPSE